MQDEAEVACQTELDTHLISIHSEEDYLEAKLLCLYGTNGGGDCWTGLRETKPNEYTWTDGSNWDYATDTDSYPFSPGNNPFLAGCVALWSNDDYLLRNGLCVDKKQVLCNTPGSTFEPTQPTEETTATTEDEEIFSTEQMKLASLIIAIIISVLAIGLLVWIIVKQ